MLEFANFAFLLTAKCDPPSMGDQLAIGLRVQQQITHPNKFQLVLKASFSWVPANRPDPEDGFVNIQSVGLPGSERIVVSVPNYENKPFSEIHDNQNVCEKMEYFYGLDDRLWILCQRMI